MPLTNALTHEVTASSTCSQTVGKSRYSCSHKRPWCTAGERPSLHALTQELKAFTACSRTSQGHRRNEPLPHALVDVDGHKGALQGDGGGLALQALELVPAHGTLALANLHRSCGRGENRRLARHMPQGKSRKHVPRHTPDGGHHQLSGDRKGAFRFYRKVPANKHTYKRKHSSLRTLAMSLGSPTLCEITEANAPARMSSRLGIQPKRLLFRRDAASLQTHGRTSNTKGVAAHSMLWF